MSKIIVHVYDENLVNLKSGVEKLQKMDKIEILAFFGFSCVKMCCLF